MSKQQNRNPLPVRDEVENEVSQGLWDLVQRNGDDIPDGVDTLDYCISLDLTD